MSYCTEPAVLKKLLNKRCRKANLTFLVALAAVTMPLACRADDLIYSYCLVTIAENSGKEANTLVLLSYNLSTAEETLYTRYMGESFVRVGGRKPERNSGFGVMGDLNALEHALQLRKSAASAEFNFIRTLPAPEHLNTDNPEPCQENSTRHTGPDMPTR